jgi:hypothetical protein
MYLRLVRCKGVRAEGGSPLPGSIVQDLLDPV